MEEYVDFALLEKGKNGFILQAVSKQTGSKVTLKSVSKNCNWKRIEREIEAGFLLQGAEGISQFKGYFETDDSFWLAFDYIDGTDLFRFMEKRGFEPISENHARKILLQLIRALMGAHNKGIFHKNIKLENVIINRSHDRVYLIDFGLCIFTEPGDGSVNLLTLQQQQQQQRNQFTSNADDSNTSYSTQTIHIKKQYLKSFSASFTEGLQGLKSPSFGDDDSNNSIKLMQLYQKESLANPIKAAASPPLSAREPHTFYSNDFSGSREYSSPELLARKSFSPEKADIWALGITMFALLFGRFPFKISDAEYQSLEQNKADHPILRFPRVDEDSHDQIYGLSLEVLDLLSQMLEVDEKKRISLRKILSHPWFYRQMSMPDVMHRDQSH